MFNGWRPWRAIIGRNMYARDVLLFTSNDGSPYVITRTVASLLMEVCARKNKWILFAIDYRHEVAVRQC